MGKSKKSFKLKAGEFSYNKPTLDKKILNIRKSFGEISSILTGKKK